MYFLLLLFFICEAPADQIPINNNDIDKCMCDNVCTQVRMVVTFVHIDGVIDKRYPDLAIVCFCY